MQTEAPSLPARLAARLTNAIERAAPFWLALAFLPGMLLNRPGYAGTLYGFTTVPAIALYLCLKPSAVISCWQSLPLRCFAAFAAYSLATVLWSVHGNPASDSYPDLLATFTLLFSAALARQHRPQALRWLETLWLAAGTLCLAAAYIAWSGKVAIYNLNRGYGDFNYHVYVSWLAGLSCLVLLSRRARLAPWQWLLFCGGFATTILSHSRGGFIAFCTGYAAMLLRQNHPLREKQVVLGIMATIALIYTFLPFHLHKFIDKGTDLRPEIWQHGYARVTRDISTLWFGNGINSNDSFQIKSFYIQHYHSLYWSQLFHGGLAGLALCLVLLVAVLREGWRHAARDEPWFYLLVGMCAALAVYGDQFFASPSAFFTCFLFPFMMTLFARTPRALAGN